MSKHEPRWYDDSRIADVFDRSPDAHLRAMQARGEALAAAIHRDEETHDLVVIDDEGCDRFLDTMARDYDVSPEAA